MIKRFFGLLTAITLSMTFLVWNAYAQFQIEEYVPENSAEWVLQEGDWILANVAENTLQFVREDHSDSSEPIDIGSGINTGKRIHYLGMTYNPQTPEDVWEIKSKHQQGWWNVFGSREADEQLFLRMYRVRGEQRIYSHYGIHTTPDIDVIMDEQDGFGSWGCLLTEYDLLKTIESLYELNGQSVKVVTTRQNPDDLVSLLQAF